MAGIYIHIPFCRSKCGYCDFYSITDLGRMGDVVSALKTELRFRRNYFGEAPVGTIYFGGGTPSLCRHSHLRDIIGVVKELWDTDSLTEVTAEANPDDIAPEYLHGLAAAGVNRLSIGIQSFIDRDLRFMNRRHDAESAVRAVKQAQQAGFTNITADLIYGIPGMSLGEWRDNVMRMTGLGVQHISAYHLIIEEGTPFGKLCADGKLSPVPEERSEEQYLLLHELLTGSGFEHYEISNFALPGFRAVHNSSYWNGEPYLGVGPSSHSYNGTQRHRVVDSVTDYISGAGGELIYEEETLTREDMYNEFVMVSLRRAEGVDIRLLEQRFGAGKLSGFLAVAKKHIVAGNMKSDGETYYMPPEKFLISDSVISDFFV